MALPFIGHHDAAEIGMAGKADTEEIEDFAFVEVRRGPHRRDAGDFRVEFDQDAEPDALLQAVRKNVVGHLKSGFVRIPVDAGDIFEKVISRGLEGSAHGAKVIAVDPQGQFALVESGIGDAGGLDREQGSDGVVLGVGGEDGVFICRGVHHRSTLSADQSSIPFFAT